MDEVSPVDAPRRSALALLSRFAAMSHGEAMAHTLDLEPRETDWEQVFVGEAAARAREGYRQHWAFPVALKPREGQSIVRLTAVLAMELGLETDASRAFPAGYRTIAHLLQPERVWVAWSYLRPGETRGMAWDGLVWVDEHWAWFPRPWRALGG